MNQRHACTYAIIRYAPYVETGEFANIGIVTIAPTARFFGFLLLKKRRHGRITRFFDELEPKTFTNAAGALEAELERVQLLLNKHGFDKRLKNSNADFARTLFAEVTRIRETVIQFGELRTILAENPKTALEELFGYYVQRNFVTKEYRETVLEGMVRKWLKAEQMLEQFTKRKIGDAEYNAPFPFVKVDDREQPVKVIKPLALTQDTSSKIIEHGGAWLFKISELKKRRTLPREVLFAIERPEGDGKRLNACNEMVDRFTEEGITTIPLQQKERLLDFARNSPN